MRDFNKLYVLTEVLNNYYKSFPDVENIPAVVSSYGYRDKTGKDFHDVFICIDSNNLVIGFAMYYVSKNILRYYDYEGSDAGLETGMKYVPIKKGKIINSIKKGKIINNIKRR